MKKQAIDSKGNYLYLYRVSGFFQGIEEHQTRVIKRKRPIKRFGKVLDNLIHKDGLAGCFSSGELRILEVWEYKED